MGFTDASLKKIYSSLNLVNNNKQNLVVWGTNLSSQVGTGRFTVEKYKNYFKLLKNTWTKLNLYKIYELF